MAGKIKSKPTLLIIEDNSHWASIFERTFHTSCETVKAENLREAELLIPELLKSRLDIAIVDIRLKEDEPTNKDGILALQTLRENGIPTIAVSAFATIDIVRDAFVLANVKDFWFKGENYNPAQWRSDVQIILEELQKKDVSGQPVRKDLKPYYLALASTIIIFVMLTIIVGVMIVIAPEYISVVLGLGFLLTIVMIITLSLIVGKITGKQFTEIIKDILTKK
jgi:hypothetical protein